MKTKFIENEFTYDGSQLRSLFCYLDHGLQGDSVVAWIGPCAVSNEHMVDGEDLSAGAIIAGARMVHFVVEKFHISLFAAVALQRLFSSICLEQLREMSVDDRGSRLRRDGDDLYFELGKLSISIATVSPVSGLIHFAVNCTNQGTPVKTAALADLGVDPAAFAKAALTRLQYELSGIDEATVKVRWVK